MEQGTDGTNIATIDLSGGGGGTNTVVCSNSVESIYGVGGPDPGGLRPEHHHRQSQCHERQLGHQQQRQPPPDEPDLFSCTRRAHDLHLRELRLTCTNAGGVDGMDAVYTSTGTITQNGAGLSSADCTLPMGGQACGPGGLCPLGQCCDGLTQKCVVSNHCQG